MKDAIKKTYGSKGDKVLNMNYDVVKIPLIGKRAIYLHGRSKKLAIHSPHVGSLAIRIRANRMTKAISLSILRGGFITSKWSTIVRSLRIHASIKTWR